LARSGFGGARSVVAPPPFWSRVRRRHTRWMGVGGLKRNVRKGGGRWGGVITQRRRGREENCFLGVGEGEGHARLGQRGTDQKEEKKTSWRGNGASRGNSTWFDTFHHTDCPRVSAKAPLILSSERAWWFTVMLPRSGYQPVCAVASLKLPTYLQRRRKRRNLQLL